MQRTDWVDTFSSEDYSSMVEKLLGLLNAQEWSWGVGEGIGELVGTCVERHTGGYIFMSRPGVSHI